MSTELDKIGIKVVRKTTVGDLESEILAVFAEAETRADVILITGGLGPTSDDLTKDCLAKFFNCSITIHEEALAEVTEFFKSRGRELTELNRQQAALPTACQKITNALGTAPGMWFDKRDKVFMSMPVIHHKIIRTIGIGESFLAEKIADWENALPKHIKLAYLPSLGEVKLRLTGFGTSLQQLESETNVWVEKLKERVGQFIYGFGEDPIEVVLGKTLRDRNLTLSIAESCTGGYLSHLITSVPGSSEYFLGTMIPYAYEIKMRQLGVKPETLEKYGAVSEPTIIEMANIVRAKFSTSIGVATSGIAGPGGATPDKPVGTVWFGWQVQGATHSELRRFAGDRAAVRAQTVRHALARLARLLG